MSDSICNLVFFSGLSMILVGLWMIYIPLALIAGGGCLIVLGMLVFPAEGEDSNTGGNAGQNSG